MPTSPRRANLTLDERIAVVAALSSFLRDGVLKRDAVKRRLESNDTAINLASCMAKSVGRHPKRSHEEIIAAIKQMSLAAAAKLPKMTLVRLLKSGGVRKYNSRVKAFVTPANKKQRSNEDDVQRAAESKHYVPTIMFIAAAARPRYDTTRARWVLGKLGIWPFIVMEPAERASKNRPAGTMVTKAVNVTKDVYRQALLTHVPPAIKERWPSKKTPTVIQRDNARPHVSPMDATIVAAGKSGGWDIGMQFQPPNSPDLNILDLGFFNSIQAIQYQHQPKNLDELIACVSEAFEQLHRETLDDVFLTIQSVMQELLKNHGGNQFKIPRMSKVKKRKAGVLADAISCDWAVYETVSAFQF